MQRLIKRFGKFLLLQVNRTLKIFDFELARVRRNYIAAGPTIKAAKLAGKSIGDYLEDIKAVKRPKFKGRIDRIIIQMKEDRVFEHCENICEIGAGTGMYLEKVKRETNCKRYEVYEIDKEWSQYLADEYGAEQKQCDGFSLKSTPDESISLVHAHAVFVYIPFLNILDYLSESFRVVKDDGSIVFDVFTENSFVYPHLENWLKTENRFPVIIPEKILLDYIAQNNFYVSRKFSETYGGGISEYFILKKNKTVV